MGNWQPSLVLFDLGGVLFDYRGAGSLERMRGAPFVESELSEFWSKSHWAISIATGRCTPIEFASGAIDELSLNATPREFLSEFRTWLLGYLPGSEALIQSLSRQTRIACLSNTNELDASRFRTEFGIEAHFEACFLSNEIGLRKPDGSAYRHVLDSLEVEAEDVLFLDDTEECVEGARAIGLRAELAVGPNEARRALSGYFSL